MCSVTDTRMTEDGGVDTGVDRLTTGQARSFPTFAASWVVAGLSTVILKNDPASQFERYFGSIDPLPAVGIVGSAGARALARLQADGWVGEARDHHWGGGTPTAIGAAVAFGGAVIGADVSLGFPRDINVPWPTSLLFYPTMGFVAESVFHLVPLAAIVTLGRRYGRAGRPAVAVVVPITLVAVIESAFQVIAGGEGRREPWLSVYLALHMFGFGATQLTLLRRHGFGTTMLMRLVYYLIWHVLWGSARLRILF